ncbi:hypothetical protein EVA_18381 [gut metagenome]|uniref:Uncharacterized protein n=1 Tax=gut metagenome TaxID=749906 RepID=J9FVA8_9ZZZZ
MDENRCKRELYSFHVQFNRRQRRRKCIEQCICLHLRNGSDLSSLYKECGRQYQMQRRRHSEI